MRVQGFLYAFSRMAPYWFPWLIGMPCETTVGICSLMLGGVLERYPNLKVCFAHGAGSFPFTLGRIEHGFQVGSLFFSFVSVAQTSLPSTVKLIHSHLLAEFGVILWSMIPTRSCCWSKR